MITYRRAAKAAVKHMSKAWLGLRKVLGAPTVRHCPACDGDVVGFFRYGDCAEWGCPKCGASPRERLMHHLLDTQEISVPPGAVLHMAPNEASLVARFRQAATDYVPADLDPSRYPIAGIRKVDLMEIAETERFDIVYASHVMEHVPDDVHVLANLHRALKPGGEAWLMVPLWDRETEDGSFAMPPRERERRFGQWDHVRQYGLDFRDRLAAAGFEVRLEAATDAAPEVRDRQALGDILFRAVKPGVPAA